MLISARDTLGLILIYSKNNYFGILNSNMRDVISDIMCFREGYFLMHYLRFLLDSTNFKKDMLISL